MVDKAGRLAMAEKNRPRSALASAAERLGQMARTAGEQRMIETAGIRFPLTGVYSTSPDEEWSRKFMSQGIGPSPACTEEGGFCPMPFDQLQFVAPSPIASAPKPQAAAVHQAPPSERVAASADYIQIGQAIGKPLKRRWFAPKRP